MTTLSEHFGFVPDYYTAFLRMSHGVHQKVCGQCGLQGNQLKTCSQCRSAWYCNEEHQRQHWDQHRLFCVTKNTCQRMAAGAMGGMGVGVAGVGGGTSAKSQKKAKKKSQETNFHMDKAVLDEVAGSQLYHQQYHQQAGAVGHNEMQFQGGGGQGRGRRKSPTPDLSTPIDSSHHPLEATQVSQSKTPPLYHVTDSVDSQSLEEGGFSQEWFSSVLQLIMQDLNEYGVCVVDDFLGEWLWLCVCVKCTYLVVTFGRRSTLVCALFIHYICFAVD